MAAKFPTELLSLVLYNFDPGCDVLNVNRAIKSMNWAVRTLKRAMEESKSKEARALMCSGFVAVVLTSPGNKEVLVTFEAGNNVSVDTNGRGLLKDGARPQENAREALSWLEKALAYADWVALVEFAQASNSRPPVYDSETLVGLDPLVREWIGAAAERYFQSYRQSLLKRAAEEVRSQQEQTSITVKEETDAA